MDMKEKMQMGCLTGQDQGQVIKQPQRNVDHDYIAFIRLKFGYSAEGALDMAYRLGSILRQWPIDLPGLYSASDAFTIASKFEIQGPVVLEAMATGKPVIGIKHRAIAELINNDMNGIHVH